MNSNKTDSYVFADAVFRLNVYALCMFYISMRTSKLDTMPPKSIHRQMYGYIRLFFHEDTIRYSTLSSKL